MRKNTLSGFTLIELMIVIAIIGVLAMFAVPSYQAYVIRAMATDAMSLAEQAKTAVMEYYLNTGKFPENNADAGLAEPEEINTSYIAQVTIVENGNITITFRSHGIPEPIRDATWEFTPELNNGQITWACNNGSLDLKYRPTICRSDQT